MNTRFEFTDLLNEYVKRENRRPSQLASLTGIPKRSIENWLKGHSRRARDWHDVVKLAKALNLSPAETDKLLGAAGHPTIEALWDAADAEDIKVLERLSSTTAPHEPTSFFHGDQVTGNKFGGDQVTGYKFGGDQVSGTKFEGRTNIRGDLVTGGSTKIEVGEDYVTGDQYKSGGHQHFGPHVSHGSDSSSSQRRRRRRQASSEWFRESDFRQPVDEERSAYRSPQPSPSVGTELMPPVATPEVFQIVKALEAELNKGRGAHAKKVGQLLTQLDRDRTVNEEMYVQLLRKIADSPNVSSSVRSTVLNRLKRIY